MQLLNDSPHSSHTLDLSDPLDRELATLLHNYHVVFDPSTALPPPRSHDHSIILVEGSPLVKVKPYRYLHCQKEGIENLVKGLLKDGLIRPSKSPFSSTMILVEKKDCSWRVCTDYRALMQLRLKILSNSNCG